MGMRTRLFKKRCFSGIKVFQPLNKLDNLQVVIYESLVG